jgi:cholesterol transport system auxiliary component
MNKTLRNAVLTVTLAFALGACVSFGGKAPPSLLVLTASNTVANGTAKSGASSDALIVLLPEAPRTLDTNRVPVQTSDSSLAYLKDAVWADKPSRLMQSLLMETIAAKTGRLVLNETDAGGKAMQYLSGGLIAFGLDASTSEAVVVYDAVKLVRGVSVDKKRFEARRPVSAVEAGPAGIALNEAANDVAVQVSDWIG